MGECIAPLRERVIANNDRIGVIDKMLIIHGQKITDLEVIYKNVETDGGLDASGDIRVGEGNSYEDPDLHKFNTKPSHIFDLIKNKIAENASISRKNEEDIRGVIKHMEANFNSLKDIVQTSEIRVDKLADNFKSCNDEMVQLVGENAQFKKEMTASLDSTIADTAAKLNQLKLTSSMLQDDITKLRGIAEICKEGLTKQDKIIEFSQSSVLKLQRDVETMAITKSEEKSFQDLRTDVLDKCRRSSNQIQDVNNKIEATDNYLARYLPFNSFCSAMEVSKIVTADLIKNKKMTERIQNYEQFKMKELYSAILFDDGRAPKQFEKDNLVVGRDEINQIIQKDVKISSRNLRSIRNKAGARAENSRSPTNLATLIKDDEAAANAKGLKVCTHCHACQLQPQGAQGERGPNVIDQTLDLVRIQERNVQDELVLSREDSAARVVEVNGESYSAAPYQSQPALSHHSQTRVRNQTPQRNEIDQASKAKSEMNVQPSQVSSELQDRIDDLMRYNKEKDQKKAKHQSVDPSRPYSSISPQADLVANKPG